LRRFASPTENVSEFHDPIVRGRDVITVSDGFISSLYVFIDA
jgi:hypothetical protein